MTDHPTLERAAPDHHARTASDTAVAFAELISADAGLLHAEFDAIIAANFPPGDGQRSQHPPRRPGPPVTDRPRPAAPPSPAAAADDRSPTWVGAQPHTRQRSPPPADRPTTSVARRPIRR